MKAYVSSIEKDLATVQNFRKWRRQRTAEFAATLLPDDQNMEFSVSFRVAAPFIEALTKLVQREGTGMTLSQKARECVMTGLVERWLEHELEYALELDQQDQASDPLEDLSWGTEKADAMVAEERRLQEARR